MSNTNNSLQNIRGTTREILYPFEEMEEKQIKYVYLLYIWKPANR